MKKAVLNFAAMTVLSALATSATAQVVFIALEPASVAGNYDFTYTDGWGMDMTANSVQDTVVVISDGTAGDTLGCIATTNNVAGKIALIYRGTCEFGAKALAAQTAGAVGVIVVNNVSGAPIAMGPGAVGAQVTIPVVMISQADGALLRPSIDANECVVFIGTIAGLYTNNLSIYKRDIASTNGFAIPRQMAYANSGFVFPPQAWIRNYGTAEQTNAILNCKINFGGDDIYDETSPTGLTIPAGDSALVVLPDFSMANPGIGEYTVTYTITADSTDDYGTDNVAGGGFWVNPETYSRARMDPATGNTLSNNGLRPNTGTEFDWCVAFQSSDISSLELEGMSFSVTTTQTATDTAFLTGLGFQLNFFEWNDDITTTVTFDNLNQIGDAFYDFTAHTPDVQVRADFAEPIALQNDQKYLGCLHVFDDSVFVRVDGGIDYNTNYDAYPTEAFYPIYTDAWYAGGFGSDYVPGLVFHFHDPLFDGINDNETVELVPYPNPTVQFVNVPLNRNYSGSVSLQAYDASGRMVYSDDINMNGTDVLRVDAKGLASGLNIFNLRYSDGTTSSFRVMVSR